MKNNHSIWADETGTAAVEYNLITAVIAIPLFFGILWGLWTLEDHYSMWAYFIGWPFP